MSVVFFTDRDLGKRFPEILASAGCAVERHGDLFAHDTPDEEWLEYVGKSGRVAITHDGRIRYKPNELAAVVRHRVALLVVLGKAPFPLLARNFVGTLPAISSFLERHRPPCIAKIHRPSAAQLVDDHDTPGSISLWYPRK